MRTYYGSLNMFGNTTWLQPMYHTLRNEDDFHISTLKTFDNNVNEPVKDVTYVISFNCPRKKLHVSTSLEGRPVSAHSACPQRTGTTSGNVTTTD